MQRTAHRLLCVAGAALALLAPSIEAFLTPLDVTLGCDIPNADLYFINPAGVMFGPDSALNLKGAFAVTTADQVKFKDGAIFTSSLKSSVLSVAAPASFGFWRWAATTRRRFMKKACNSSARGSMASLTLRARFCPPISL